MHLLDFFSCIYGTRKYSIMQNRQHKMNIMCATEVVEGKKTHSIPLLFYVCEFFFSALKKLHLLTLQYKNAW